jgi:hypothetical protein
MEWRKVSSFQFSVFRWKISREGREGEPRHPADIWTRNAPSGTIRQVKQANLIFLGLLAAGALPMAGAQTNSYPPQLAAFSTAKEQQESQLAGELHVPLPAEVKDFFNSAHQGDYLALSKVVDRLGAQLFSGYSSFTNGQPAWLPFWQPMTEVESAYELFALGGTKYPLAFGEGIIRSIPAGSIYFGGTDAGRMLVTALCFSHAEGKPFYTLTQNALSDGRYMDYLRAMYGKEIHLPTTNDVQKAIDDYKSDALRRYEQGQLKPGEVVQNGQVQLNGQVPVMGIHALLVKWILDHNPGPEFYYEESSPQELLYPYLSPHFFIFKLNHEPLPALPETDMDADRAFWSKQFATVLGGWLEPNTPVSNLCLNVETVYRERDLSHFNGDREFLTNAFASEAFSKLRVSIAGLYEWRLMNGSKTDNAGRLKLEADYAFRQAYSLCPTSPEVLFRYVNFLESQRRFDDAILVVRTTLGLTPADDHFHDRYENLMMQLKQYREQAGETGK